MSKKNDWTKLAKIDWKHATPSNLYMLQYYGKTAYIRSRAKRELLKREAPNANH